MQSCVSCLKRYGHFALAAILFSGSVCFAQNETKPFEDHKEIAPESETPAPIQADLMLIVSATKGLAQDPLNLPQAVNVVPESELQSTVYTNPSQALRTLLPNVGLNQAAAPLAAGHAGNTTSNYWSEGFSIRGLGGARVLTLTDGVRQVGNGIGYGGGNLALYDLYSIEKIEVIRGPASVMYGTDALGGVVNLITRSPHRRTTLGTDADAMFAYDGSRNFWRTGAFVDVGDKSWGLTAGGGFTDAGCPRLPGGNTTQAGSYHAASGWLKFDGYISEKARLRLIANTTKDTDVKAVNTMVNGRDGPAPFIVNFPLYQRSMLGAELEVVDITPHIQEFNIGLYWQQLRRKSYWQNILYVGPSPASNNVFLTGNDTANTYELQPYLRLDFEPQLITLGVDIGLDTVNLPENKVQTARSRGFIPISVPAPSYRTVAKAQQWRFGLYAQDSIDLDPFEVVLGGRGDYFRVEDEISNTKKDPFGFSGSMGLVYHLNELTSLYSNVATGYRVPDLGERFQNKVIPFHGNVTVKGNSSLKSERSYTAEIGAKRHEGWVQFETAVFINEINNYIGLNKLSKTLWQYTNQGNVTLYGVEAGTVLFPELPFQIYANIGRTWAEQRNKIALPNVTANFGALYNINPGGHVPFAEIITPEIIGRAAGRSRDTLSNVSSPGFVVWNLQLTVQLATDKHLDGSLIIGVNNLFNTVYYEPFFGDPQPKRGVFTSVQVAY
jgi:hemoglobin/transferrin/lactoferrin receptor protein